MAESRWIRSTLLTGLALAGLVLIVRSDAGEVSPTLLPAAEPVREGPECLPDWSRGVGDRVADLCFNDLDGNPGRLRDGRDCKVTVCCFTGIGCPVAKKYGPTVVELEKRYRTSGVRFVLVNPDASAPPEQLQKAFAALKDQGFGGRYVHDRSRELTAGLGARSSTEAFVVDSSGTLVYRGAIDDQFGLGYALPEPRQTFLADAIKAVVEGTQPAVLATTAPGCALEQADCAAKPAEAVTYHNQISRLLQRRCQECHRAGENAPFSLMSYDESKDHLAMIKKVVKKGTMPPWYADAKVGHWANDRSLSDREKSDLIGWIEAGAPAGDVKDSPVPRVFTDGWKFGKPDVVFEASRAIHIPAKGPIPYQYAVIATNLPEDKWVQAVEIRTPNPQVVHHLLVFATFPAGHPNARDQIDFKGGTKGYFAGMVPGQGSMVYPAGTAKRLPKGATLLMQIHYTPDGTAVDDKPKIGFRFADKPPEHEILTLAASNQKLRIPPGAANHEVTATYSFGGASRLTSFNPHSHVRGKAYRYELQYPDGRTETVLEVPRYDFNWQIEYHLAKPIDVPAGTVLKVTAWFDNSAANPANPDPTKEVRFGEQTYNEMMIGYFTGHRLP